MPDHDHPYKEIFGDPDPVADLLRLLFPDQAPLIDFASLDRRNGSYVAEDWRERENDVIWRVRWGGEDLYVYLLLEFQSEADRDMAVRLLTYIGLLWQDLRRSGAIASDAPLPPVLPVVLYNGEQPWRAPRDLDAARGPVPPILLPYQPQLAFLLLDETRMAIRPDQAERNLAAAVFRLEQAGDPSVHRTIATQVIAWLRETDRTRLIASFQRWWGRTLSQRHEFPADLNPFAEDAMLAERINQWKSDMRNEWRAEGRAEGQAEGRAKGLTEGRAEGLTEGLIDLVREGLIDRTGAAARLRDLHARGDLNDQQLAQALARLG